MELRVLLFGPAAAAADAASVTVRLGEGATVASLGPVVGAACPALASMLPSLRVAVNGDFASPGDSLRPGDEVALIGLVSGG